METKDTDNTRRKSSMASNLSLLGSGVGLTVFVLYGLLNASLIGGLVGLNIAGAIMGFPVETTLVAKVIVTTSMLFGVMLTALVFTLVGASGGWLAGSALDTARNTIHHMDKAHAAVKH